MYIYIDKDIRSIWSKKGKCWFLDQHSILSMEFIDAIPDHETILFYSWTFTIYIGQKFYDQCYHNQSIEHESWNKTMLHNVIFFFITWATLRKNSDFSTEMFSFSSMIHENEFTPFCTFPNTIQYPSVPPPVRPSIHFSVAVEDYSIK